MLGVCLSLKTSGVLEYCGFLLIKSSLINDEKFLSFTVDHVFKIDRLLFA